MGSPENNLNIGEHDENANLETSQVETPEKIKEIEINESAEKLSSIKLESDRIKGILRAKQKIGLDVSVEEAQLMKLRGLEMKQNLLNTSKWIEGNVLKLENEKLSAAGIEVFSDQSLSETDINFLCDTKGFLDSGDGKNVRVVIVNKDHWPEVMKTMGRDEKQIKFAGRAKEYGIVPDGVDPFVVLPSSDVFIENTSYGEMYKQSPEFQEKAGKPGGVEDLYRGIYLRNVVSHEISHLYQVSKSDAEAALAGDTGPHDSIFEARELLACAFGLWSLKKSAEPGFSAYLDACKKVVISNIGDSYAIDQAQRSLYAAELINSSSDEELKDLFDGLYAKCRASDDGVRNKLEDMATAIRKGEISAAELKSL